MTAPPHRGIADDERLAHLAEALTATRRGTRGLPRSVAVGLDGRRVCFLRAASADDPRQGLWSADEAGHARLLVDPERLGDDADVDDVERAMRERTREQATGITAFAGTPDLAIVAFAHGGRIHVVATDDGDPHTLDVAGPVVDPRPSPTGRHVAWVAGGALHVAGLDGGDPRVLATDPDPAVTWGWAEFIAAEEMGRFRGYWWSPDGRRLAVCRVDVGPVDRWWLHDPGVPQTPPTTLRYPAAGTANAVVDLAVVDLDGNHTPVAWDREAMPYLAEVRWDAGGPLTFAVQRRDQRQVDVMVVAGDGGEARVVRSITADPWVELIPGTPRWTPGGRLVTVEDDAAADTRRLVVGERTVSAAGLHIDAVLAARGDDVVVTASTDDPAATVVWSVPLDGGHPEPLSPLTGVHHAVVGGDTMVVHSQHADDTAGDIAVHRGAAAHRLPQVPADLPLRPRPRLATLAPTRLRAALLLPSWYEQGEGERQRAGGRGPQGEGERQRAGGLPVLLDPYGGPHARRVRQAARGFLTSQWFAEAGFAVLVIDGRGTPGRGLAWEHAVAGDLATCPLEDQVRGLHAAAERWPMLDLNRVAIRGWSFGGFLAALAVLRRPDVFHVAIAGAPVTDWRLYDTHYTERYLGDPTNEPAAYKGSSLLADAPHLRRPLMLLHGLADDNVVAAHTLRLSRELLRAGRPHTVLPLPDTTHVTRDPRQESRLLSIQLDFIREALGASSPPSRQ